MKIAGTVSLDAAVEEVWNALNDPTVLQRTLPGCERLTEVAPDSYAMTLTAGVASVKGTYQGKVLITDQLPPNSFLLKASGTGVPGTVDASVRVNLTESSSGGTSLTYDADAIVGGMIGGVGQRMLTGVSKKMAGQFFSAVDDAIRGDLESGAIGGVLPADVEAPAAGTASVTPPAHGETVFPGGGPLREDQRILLVGVLVGAAIALAGVATGLRAGRRLM